MREVAYSLEEVCARHGCSARFSAVKDLPRRRERAPNDAVAVYSRGLTSTVLEVLPVIRGGYEIVEVYVRADGSGSVFEPLTAAHFAVDGECVVVARWRRSSNEARIVGIMLAKDEADAIPEVVANLSGQLDALYYSAGDEATAAAIEAGSLSGWARSVAVSDAPRTDGLRQFLLERARLDAAADGDLRPMWVMVVQGDEIYHDDLRHHVMLAQAERATVMACQVATFVIHESQRHGWDWSLPLDKRLTHYVWDLGEHAGFLDFPWVYYNPVEHMRAHPHGIFPSKYASARPVRKHYPFRSPDQAAARIADRLRASAEHPNGWQPHYKNYDVFVGDIAGGRDVRCYHGWFGEAERIEGIW